MIQKELAVLQLGHPHLRRIAKTVIDTQSACSQNIIRELLQFVEKVKGIGIAAPQVDIDQRIFIMASKPNERYPKAPKMEPTAVLNPEIIWADEKQDKDWEGCLSIPGIRALVPRPASIEVRYQCAEGRFVEKKFEGYIARVFLHELDHLIGKVFLDRVVNNHDIITEDEWFQRYL